MEPHEADAAWLCQYRYLSTQSDIEAFCERVSIRVADGMSERQARVLTLEELRRGDV